MSRGQSIAILAICVALVLGPAVALAGGTVLGSWKPAGPQAAPPATTPEPELPGSEATGYGEFLDDVRAGHVLDVFQSGLDLSVSTQDGGYQVRVPDPSVDVIADIESAALESGIPPPAYFNESEPPMEPQPLTYEEMLEQVRTGRVRDVLHQGDRLQVSTNTRVFEVEVPLKKEVLADIEAAAASGGVPAPPYTKVPD